MLSFLELLFALVGEVLGGFSFLKRTGQKTEVNIIVVWFFTFVGYAAGGLSLWFYPRPFLHDATSRMASVFVVPLCAALLVFLIGWACGLQQRLASVFVGTFMGTMGMR